MITDVLIAGEAAARRRAGPGSGRCWPAVAPSSTRDGAVQAHIASFWPRAHVLHWALACPAVVSRCRTTISTAFRWVSRRRRTDCSTEPIRAARRARMSSRHGAGIGVGGKISASESSFQVMIQSPSTPDADAAAESAPAAVNRVLRPYRGACPVTQQIRTEWRSFSPTPWSFDKRFEMLHPASCAECRNRCAHERRGRARAQERHSVRKTRE